MKKPLNIWDVEVARLRTSYQKSAIVCVVLRALMSGTTEVDGVLRRRVQIVGLFSLGYMMLQ